ncbi:hypothetical protein [Sinorhizobium fredii]
MLQSNKTWKRWLATVRLVVWPIAATVGWLLLLWGVVAGFSPRTLGRQLTRLQQLPLNEIGDFLAGAVAPIGLIWLIATVWLQLRSLNAANQEFETSQENAFRLALFDKRLQVKHQFQDAVLLLHLDDESQRKAINALSEAMSAAEYLFDDSIRETLKDVLERAQKAKFYDLEYDRLQRKSARTPEEEKSFDKAINGRHDISLWMINNLTPERITEMFRPYLEMPEPAPNRLLG